MLSEVVGLTQATSFRQGDATALPFADESFDHAWTQHVAMNVADKRAFYAEIHRVMKRLGRLAIHDVVAGNGGPLAYPVPWARSQDMSFLITPEAFRAHLKRTGFEEISWLDCTDAAIAWFARQNPVPVKSGPVPALGLHIVMGPEFRTMAGNLARNLNEGRVRIVRVVAERN